MLRIGLTGNIASGKSMVARLLEDRGAVIIDADRIGHELIGPDGPARAAVLERFGPGILGPDGEIDRGRLGRIVFADPAARQRLNEVVHPLLIAGIRRRLAAAAEQGVEVIVLDAALLYEFGLEGEFDRIVAVSAPAELRVARLVVRGLPVDEAWRRVRAQGSPADKEKRADRVIVNDGRPEELAASVADFWRESGAAARQADRGKDGNQ